MDSTLIRLIVYLSLVGLITTGSSMLWLARGRFVKPTHVPLALAALILLALWFLMLAFSIQNLHWLTRETLVWPLTMAAGGASVLGWAWLILACKVTFRIERKSDDRHGSSLMLL